MKQLATSDVFAAMRIVKAAQLSDEVARMGALVKSGHKVNMEEVGLQFVFRCIEKCAGTEAEKAIYNFLGNILDIEPKKIAATDPFELFDLLTEYKAQFFDGEENQKRVASFFGCVAKLMS